MYRSMNIKSLSVAISALVLSTSANSALVERLGGLAYYDDVADLTWLADANYAQTSGYDADGKMTWADANAWAAGLDVAGVTGWRLAAVTDTGTSGCNFAFSGTDCGYNTDTSTGEMTALFHDTLGNVPYADTAGNYDQPSWDPSNTGPFSNIQQDDFYWSSTVYANDYYAWRFSFYYGIQDFEAKDSSFKTNYAWAVQSGDVSAVPVPAAAWLFGSGLLGLIGIARRKKV